MTVPDSPEREDGSGTSERPPAETFGQRLRRLRERAGLSQVALAGGTLHASYVSLLEADRRSPTEPVLRLLAERLGSTSEELSGRSDADPDQRLLLAQAALGMGRTAEAVSLLEGMSHRLTPQLLASSAHAFHTGDVYATALERCGRLDDATTMFERLRTAAETAPSRLPWIGVTVALVRCYRAAGDVARAVDLGEEALRRYRELRLEGMAGHSQLVSTLAGAYSERGDHLRAQVMLGELIEQTGRTGSLDERAYALWNAGITAAERGHVGEGLRLVDQAETLLSVSNDARSQARLQVTSAWLLLAAQPPDAPGARRILRQALPHLRQHAGEQSVASAETELARCELLLGRPQVARRLAQSALKRLAEESRIERAGALAVLGAALVAEGDRSAGVTRLEDAARALADAQAPRQAAGIWRQLSDIYRRLGDSARALEAADRALDGVGVVTVPVLSEKDHSAARLRRSKPRRATAKA